MAKYVIFENNKFEIDESMTLDEVQGQFGDVIPGLDGAEGHEDSEGNLVFTKKAGTKGC